MNGKNVLLVLSGIAIGYLLFKERIFGKKNTVKETAEEVTEKVKEAVLGGDRQTQVCEEKWMEVAKVSKFASQKAMEEAKAEFLANCMKGV